LPTVGVTSHGETCSASSEDITPRSQLMRTHAPNLLALPSFGYSPRSESLCRLLPAPAASGFFPTLFCKSFPRCLVPYPDGPTECSYLFLPRCHRPSPKHYGSASRFVPRTRLSAGLFRDCRHFVMFRPLSLLASQIAPTAASFPTGQPRLLPPGISCFVTSARSGYAIRPLQVIDGKRTFTFPDLQPCRLLQCLRWRHPGYARS